MHDIWSQWWYKRSSEDAIGLTNFCANKSIVSSYAAIFEILRQGELYEQVRASNEWLASANEQLASVNEQLKVHDKMHQEFINIAAAHVLRTPIMLILRYAELLEYEFDSTQKQKIMPT